MFYILGGKLMKTIKIKVLLIIVLLGIFILFGTTNVKAVLQANGGEGARKNIDQWMLQIRQMQAPGGTFGLRDEINTSNLSSNNKNLDVHMQKNTEYGVQRTIFRNNGSHLQRGCPFGQDRC